MQVRSSSVEEPERAVGESAAHRDGMTPHDHADDVLLCDGCAGQWTLRTVSGSIYLLDLDARTATRVPDPEGVQEWLGAGLRRPVEGEFVAGPTGDEAAFGRRVFEASGRPAASALRGDGNALRLVHLDPVRHGAGALLLLAGVGPEGVVTTRATTPVESVAPADGTPQ